MRIDKFLKNSRIIKRRTIAKEACEQGKVTINGKTAKPGDEVKVLDEVTINFGNGSKSFQILEIKENVQKSEATNLYKILD
ncbi:RNA-binding S4 domain-containing protein [Tissierella creatinophila]|uniref:RQC P-site tRNA stabilizing factor n=1 Tax=Tissierella creatinophila DSM 6911 TaxID=1123403 RepID=A0A1U7M735_TISCR|nr:RNA-binding S4 domain-containing protein [Tissierella creatinophila]OLS03008.1 heat shock protein 15 [Tissierella creatinophila DSM 6911]